MKKFTAWATALTLTFAAAPAARALVNVNQFTGGSRPMGTLQLPPLTIPSSFKIAYRALQPATGLSYIGLSWTDTSEKDVSTKVERSTNGTTWVTRRTFNTALAGPQAYTDTDLQPDTKYCYRVTSYGPAQQFVQTSPRCVLTQVAGDPGVWRTELRVRVANVPDAGTDRLMTVALTLPVNDLPGGNWTAINYAIDDLEIASDMTYDLSQTGITTLHDISKISLGISHWDDPVCLRDIQLKVNGQVAYEKVWGNTPTTCKWLGGSNGPQSLLIDQARLRAHPRFAAFTNPTPSLQVLPDELASRLESAIGSLIAQRTDLAWREIDSGYGVTLDDFPFDPQVITAKLPMEALLEDWPDPNVDFELFLKAEFVQVGTAWDLRIQVLGMNANAVYDWWVDKLASILDPLCAGVTLATNYPSMNRCIDLLQNDIARSIQAGFSLTSQRLAVALPANCPRPTVAATEDGGLLFGCAPVTPKRSPAAGVPVLTAK